MGFINNNVRNNKQKNTIVIEKKPEENTGNENKHVKKHVSGYDEIKKKVLDEGLSLKENSLKNNLKNTSKTNLENKKINIGL
jgi:hypothetical protein